MEPVTLMLASGASLTVRLIEGALQITSGEGWEQRLTREEAWRLAEALDALATAADED